MAKRLPDLKELSKGELRKLNALRKSVGEEIARDAFAKWLESKKSASGAKDKNASVVEEALQPLIDKKKLSIPRGGYILRRGRGRVIVERARQEDEG